MKTVFREIFDDPLNFFKKKRDFKQGIVLLLISVFIFVSMNQLMIQMKFVQYDLDVSPYTALIINYFTILLGYVVITTFCLIPYKIIGGKNAKNLYTVVAYSLLPAIFLWVPHILPQTIIIFLSALLITRGVAIHAKTTNKNALLVTVFFVTLVILSSLLVRNYILPLLYFI